MAGVKIFQRVKVPYGRESRPEPLASHKAAWGNPYAKGSETANSGTDEQERHIRLSEADKQPQHCNVQNTRHCLVDAAGIGGRNMRLPGEIPGNREVSRGHSSIGKRAVKKNGRSHK